MSARLEVVESPALPRGFLLRDEDPARRVYLCPRGGAAGGAPLEVLVRMPGAIAACAASADEARAWAWAEREDVGGHVDGLLARLAAPRPPFAGVALDTPRLMGIVNVTPDSFSDGGETPDAASAIARGRAMVAAGAAIVDVGGESTRPGAPPLPVEVEIERVLPVVRALVDAGAVVSIDTRHAAVMRAALAAGARIVNDITALAGDPASVRVVADSGAAVVLMHMQGIPETMQADPRYGHAPLDIYDVLAARVAACASAGIAPARIAVDPGIGFGKTLADNLAILDRLALFGGLGCAVLLGASRKSFIARLDGGAAASARLGGSLAAALAGAARGAHVIRVHDVAETRQALAVARAIMNGGEGT